MILRDRNMNNKPHLCVKNTIDIMTALPKRATSCSERLFSRESTWLRWQFTKYT